MRQTLFRIRLDDLWSLEPIGGIAAIGIGHLLLVWVVVSIILWSIRRRTTPFTREHVPGLILWCAGTTVAFAAPLWAPLQYVPIFGYGSMLLVAFVVGGVMAVRRARSVGVDADTIWDLAMWVFAAGIVGARTFYVIQYPARVFHGRQGLVDHLIALVNLPDGGVVLYGGVLLVLIAYLAFCYRRRVNPLLLGDIVAPSFFIGLAFGRIGCFLNGCCYGDRCTLPWAVTFPKDSVPYNALLNRGFLLPGAAQCLPLHPTQLYSVINALILAILTGIYFKYRDRDGVVLALGLTVYPISRIVIEMLRGDEMGQFGTGLTISQLISLGIVTVGLALGVWCWKHPDGIQEGPFSGKVESVKTK